MVEKKNPNERKRLILFVLVAIALGIVVAFLLTALQTPEPLAREVMPYDFSVTNHLSMNIDTDILHFGGGPTGSRLEREMKVSFSKDSRVVISWDGEARMSVTKNDFFLAANSSESVKFMIALPSDAARGNYTGNIFLDFYPVD